MQQIIITAKNNYENLDQWIINHNIHCLMLVCNESIRFLPDISAKIADIENKKTKIVRFSDFHPNPLYESVVSGVRL